MMDSGFLVSLISCNTFSALVFVNCASTNITSCTPSMTMELVQNWSSGEVNTLIEKPCRPPANADGHEIRNRRLITAEQTARRSINFPLLIHTGSYFAAKFGGKAIANDRVQQFRWSHLDPSACPQHYYFCGEGAFSSHRSVNTTGTQLYPLLSLRKRPRAGNNDVCGAAINTSSRAGLDSN